MGQEKTRPTVFEDGRDLAVELEWMKGLARRAGALMLASAEDRSSLDVRHKGQVDLVTRVDHELQALLVEAIGRRHPTDRIVAEESDRATDEAADARPVWYVDPLDGTTNYVHGHPFYAVSIACWKQGVPELGVVFAPALDELFSARRNAGATLEHPARGGLPQELHASGCASLDDALLATGFPYARGARARLNLALCAHALTRVRGIRRAGSAALDLCWVGAGRLDGYWELDLGPWDVAAGCLVALEAGARVSDFSGGNDLFESGTICSAAKDLHSSLLSLLEAGHAWPELDVLAPSPERGGAPA